MTRRTECVPWEGHVHRRGHSNLIYAADGVATAGGGSLCHTRPRRINLLRIL